MSLRIRAQRVGSFQWNIDTEKMKIERSLIKRKVSLKKKIFYYRRYSTFMDECTSLNYSSSQLFCLFGSLRLFSLLLE